MPCLLWIPQPRARGYSDNIANLAVDAILQVAEETEDGYEVDLDMVKLEKKPGGSLTDTTLIRGLIVDKEVVHADMPKLVRDAKIGLLNAAMEIEKTEFDSKIHIESPEEMQAYLARARRRATWKPSPMRRVPRS